MIALLCQTVICVLGLALIGGFVLAMRRFRPAR
jgi:glycosyltransferase A (GT-A) superfamily protein (DUF2064 family)